MNFSVFKQATAAQFERMQGHPLFRVAVDKDELWEAYLGAFPPGTNLLYRKRSEYDCSCCKHFIRAVGGVIAIIDGHAVSIWDTFIVGEIAYQAVADALASLVRSRPIASPFLHDERTAGTDKNFEEIVGGVKAWAHFFVNVKPALVKKRAEIPTLLATTRNAHDVFLRALKEIDVASIEVVLDLIAQQSLYRGDEHAFAVTEFLRFKRQFDEAKDKDLFAWTVLGTAPPSVMHIRNSVIGTLLTDIAEGKPLEQAVGAFEAKVAPTNYKRPTALITRAMIERAKNELEALGLTSALERRFATLSDITVNNILFADRQSKKALSGSVFDEIAVTAAVAPKSLDKIEEVPIERFLTEIVPRVESIEVLFENCHAGNLMSLVTTADPTARALFKWPNPFSWSYQGELADSIKERVKRAGGNVAGDLCCRLAWHNFDDLDFHMKEPGGYKIYFANKSATSPSGGRLDVDMNAGRGETRAPVENIFYANRATMKEGEYLLYVHNYSKRESIDTGFEVELDYLGDVTRFTYAKAVPQNGSIAVAQLKYSRAKGIELIDGLPSSQSVRTLWGLPTQTFHRATVVMLSPNHWDARAIGNKHYFFMLDGCVNDGTARGFFNEFLKTELDAHRKVFEVVGAKMRAATPAEQLSGLGFSSTQKNALVCRVKGSFTRTIRVVF
jgi:hypothetical protein